MEHNEKVLLLEVLMIDMRMDWANGVEGKLDRIYELASELGFDEIKDKTKRLIENINEDGFSGKVYRTTVDKGGYEGLDHYYQFSDRTYEDKSEAFKQEIRDLMYANGMIFEDLQFDV